MASFEEALSNSLRMYPVLYDMSLKDYINEKVNADVYMGKNCGRNASECLQWFRFTHIFYE